MKRHRRDLIAEESKRIYEHVPVDLKRALLFAKEKMASSVFTTRPLKKYGFCFPNKRDFRDLRGIIENPTVFLVSAPVEQLISLIIRNSANWVDSST